MRAAIIQPSYIPWRGYFDIIASADAFVFLDDVQYTPRDWRNRNRIKTHQGAHWLTVPVLSPHRQCIRDVRIDESTAWRRKHLQSIRQAYAAAPFFQPCFSEFSTLLQEKEDSLSALDIRLTRWLMHKLAIQTPILLSSDMAPRGTRTARLIDIVQKLGADTYLSGPSAAAYLDVEQFQRHHIQLEFKTYGYAPYPQLHGAFVPDVSVLDLLFNTGPQAKNHIRSLMPHRKVNTLT